MEAQALPELCAFLTSHQMIFHLKSSIKGMRLSRKILTEWRSVFGEEEKRRGEERPETARVPLGWSWLGFWSMLH